MNFQPALGREARFSRIFARTTFNLIGIGLT